MKLIEKIKKKERSHLISLALLLGIVIYGSIYAVWFYSLSNSVINTLGSISIPDGYFNATLDPDQPELEISISVRNTGIYQLTDFRVIISLDIEYFENDDNVTIREKVFNKTVLFGTIYPYNYFQNVIKGEIVDFNLVALVNFEANANFSKLINYILNIKITGKYFYRSIPFTILLKNLHV